MNNIKIEIQGDVNFQKNVDQAKELENAIDKAYQNFQKFGNSKVDYSTQINELQNLTTETKKYNQIQKEAANNEKNQQKIKQQELKRTELLVKQTLKDEQAILKQTDRQYQILTGSIKGLGFQLGELRQKYDSLSKAERENINIGGKLLLQIQKLDAETKKAQYSTGRFQANVGNYPFQQLQAGFSKLSLGIMGVVAGLSAMYRFGSQAIDGVLNQQEQEKKLSVILKQRTNATDEQIQSIYALTDAQKDLGVVDDDVQKAGLQQLATFVKQKDSLAQLLPAMNNLLVQQNGVNASEGDAVNIGNLMGKVLEGNVGALTRVGISFSEEEKKILQFGNEEERAATLAKVITNNVGNMNAAFANTDAGKIAKAKMAFDDMVKVIGGFLLPIFTNLMNLIPKILDGFLKFADNIKNIVAPMHDVKNAQNMFSGALSEANKRINDQKTELSFLLEIMYDETKSENERKNAMERINAINPEFLGGINSQTTSYENAKIAVEKYIESLQKQVYAEMVISTNQKIMQQQFAIDEELFKKDLELKKEQISLQEKLSKTGGQNNMSTALYLGGTSQKVGDIELRIEKLKEERAELQKQIEINNEFAKTNAINIIPNNNVNPNIPANNIVGGGGYSAPQIAPQIDPIVEFKKKQAIELQEFIINTQARTDLTLEQMDAEILKKKITQNAQLNDLLSDFQITRQDEYLQSIIDGNKMELELNDKKNTLLKKDFDNRQKEEQEINNIIISKKQLTLEILIGELKKQGKTETEIAQQTADKVAEIEFLKLNDKKQYLQDYLEFLQVNGGGEAEINNIKNQLIGIDVEIQKFKNSQIQKKEDEGNFLQKILGLDKDGINEFKSQILNLEGIYFDFLNNKKEAEIKAFDDQISLIDKSIEAENKKIESLQTMYDKEMELKNHNIDNKALEIENEIRLNQNLIDTQKAQQADLLLQKQQEQEKLKKLQKEQIWFQFAIDEASVISSVLKYAAANPLNSLTGGVAGIIQLATWTALSTANFFKAKAAVAQLAEGEIDIKKGGGTKDDVPALLMKGESVITTKGTKKAKNFLTALNKNKELPQLLQALQMDFGENALASQNIENKVSILGLIAQNEILEQNLTETQKNNVILQKILNLYENKPDYISIPNGYIEKTTNKEIKHLYE